MDELAARVVDEEEYEGEYSEDELKRVWTVLNDLATGNIPEGVAIMSNNLDRVKQHAAKQLAECKYRPS